MPDIILSNNAAVELLWCNMTGGIATTQKFAHLCPDAIERYHTTEQERMRAQDRWAKT